ncbi:hypothetical protein [Natronohydrobacter thiooxidans]|uniref:hypothetical protein n=1 Tax=Natronohydrobacter thiooxidans TaxID=87172 RepID=UPI0008FF6040|nr:hypothetical protein [Natronohydrobacter thiooxidans]
MISAVAEFAVAGDIGLDVFRRVDDRNQRRYRYECIATVSGPSDRMIAHLDHASKHPERVQAAIERYRGTGFLQQGFALGQPASYPRAGGAGSPLTVFLYLDFFRMWQIAEQEIARMTALVPPDGGYSGPEISNVLKLLLDFNRLRSAEPLIAAFLPQLLDMAARGKDDKWENAAYALRMIGDLQMRNGQPAAALAAYEGSLTLGDNPHRRGLAIRAAHAAGDTGATSRHLEAYVSKWRLPEALQAIREEQDVGQSGEVT